MTNHADQNVLSGINDTAASNPALDLPDEAAVTPLAIPGDVYDVRAEKGERVTIIAQYDLTHAKAAGNPVAPIWTDPQLVIGAYGLNTAFGTAKKILAEVFGPTAVLRPEIEAYPDTSTPTLVFYLSVPRDARHLRGDYVARYVREATIPDGAPVPTLSWEYHAIPS